MSCSETWEVGKGTSPWGCFLRKPWLLLLQLPVLAENELWSLLTQVVGSRDLPSPSLADSYPSQSDSLLTPLPSGSPAVCFSMALVSLSHWVRPGHPSGRAGTRTHRHPQAWLRLCHPPLPPSSGTRHGGRKGWLTAPLRPAVSDSQDGPDPGVSDFIQLQRIFTRNCTLGGMLFQCCVPTYLGAGIFSEMEGVMEMNIETSLCCFLPRGPHPQPP